MAGGGVVIGENEGGVVGPADEDGLGAEGDARAGEAACVTTRYLAVLVFPSDGSTLPLREYRGGTRTPEPA